MVPDCLSEDVLVGVACSKADFDLCVSISLTIVVCNDLITCLHISKGEGDLYIVFEYCQVVMIGMGTPACCDFDDFAISEVEFVEALLIITCLNYKL